MMSAYAKGITRWGRKWSSLLDDVATSAIFGAELNLVEVEELRSGIRQLNWLLLTRSRSKHTIQLARCCAYWGGDFTEVLALPRENETVVDFDPDDLMDLRTELICICAEAVKVCKRAKKGGI